MRKIISLAIIASFSASPALAGDTFVRNETVHRTNRTETSLEIDTVTNSNRTEHYNSYSEKIFFDGNVVNQTNNVNSDSSPGTIRQQFVNDSSVLNLSNSLLENDNYDETYNLNGLNGLTIHRSGSFLEGTFTEDITTRVTGTVYSVVNENFTSHETTAGVR